MPCAYFVDNTSVLKVWTGIVWAHEGKKHNITYFDTNKLIYTSIGLSKLPTDIHFFFKAVFHFCRKVLTYSCPLRKLRNIVNKVVFVPKGLHVIILKRLSLAGE